MNQPVNSSIESPNRSNYNLVNHSNSIDHSASSSPPSSSAVPLNLSSPSSLSPSPSSPSIAANNPESHSVLVDVMQSIGLQQPQSTSGLNGSPLNTPTNASSASSSSSSLPTNPSPTSSASHLPRATRSLTPQEWVERLSAQIVADMNRCGICVIDNFIGESRCDVILNEVKSLYSSGHFKNGQLVRGAPQSLNSDIRSDKIMWVDGNENECRNIGFLMRTLDNLIRNCTKHLEKKNITNRTKAMLACYPGSGSQYVKHVDNPNQDGRAITCIYYLNKNWDVEKNGGLLRIFPKGLEYVANIAPIFDRLVFFYSDRRNPHEVQPAFAVRFAITLWYYDGEERERHLKMYQSSKSST